MTEGLGDNPFKSLKARKGNLKRRATSHADSKANAQSDLSKEDREKRKRSLDRNLVGTDGLGTSKNG